MSSQKLLIVGAGGHGRSVAEAAQLSGQFEVVGFVDDGAVVGSRILGVPVLGTTENLHAYRDYVHHAIVAIGNNALRESLMMKLQSAGFEWASVIHPRSMVSPSVLIGAGSAVMAGAVIGTEAKVGVGAIVNCGAVVDHHAHVHDYGHLGVNACMAGGAVLGRSAWMQAGSSLGYGVVVEPCAVLKPGTALPV